MIKWFINLFKSAAAALKSEGSAFIKLAKHDEAILLAKGKIIALEAAHEAKHAILSELEKAAVAVHTESGKIADRIKELDASL